MLQQCKKVKNRILQCSRYRLLPLKHSNDFPLSELIHNFNGKSPLASFPNPLTIIVNEIRSRVRTNRIKLGHKTKLSNKKEYLQKKIKYTNYQFAIHFSWIKLDTLIYINCNNSDKLDLINYYCLIIVQWSFQDATLNLTCDSKFRIR